MPLTPAYANHRPNKPRSQGFFAQFGRPGVDVSNAQSQCLNSRYSCGIANMRVEGLDSGKLSNWLRKKHRILVTSIKPVQFEGIRVSPSVYSTMEEIDRFCNEVEYAMANGIA